MRTLTVKICDNVPAQFDTELEDLKVGDYVIVETDNGSEWGVAAATPTAKRANARDNSMVLRRADAKDDKQIALLLKSAVYAKAKCTELIEKLKLDMKVVSAYYNFDASKVMIYFSADNRVDFRELVRQLGGALRTRVELRQIGVRDEVKAKGAFGTCGCECCCKRYCHEYPDVSVKMAKNQNIALNPDKINGICGRLKCCLSYEDDNYRDGKPQ